MSKTISDEDYEFVKGLLRAIGINPHSLVLGSSSVTRVNDNLFWIDWNTVDYTSYGPDSLVPRRTIVELTSVTKPREAEVLG